jgi:hypothetical protein
MLWQAKTSASGSYVTMKTPSSYKIDWEDLDSNSYRSITNGNLVRSRLSSKWFKGSFSFNYLTQSEATTILNMINSYPLYVKIKSPLFGSNGVIEIECYVSKVSVEMNRNHNSINEDDWVNMSFNIVQSQVVSGQ